MKKINFILFCLLFSISAFASESRVLGLGYIFEYMDDDSNVLLFPGTLSHYKNMIILDSDYIENNGSLTLFLNDKKRDLTYGFIIQKDDRSRNLYGDISRISRELNQFIISKNNSAIFFATRGTSIEEDYNNGYTVRDYLDNYLNLTTGYGYSSNGDSALDLGIHLTFTKGKDRKNYDNNYRKEVEKEKSFESTLFLRKKKKLGDGHLRTFMEISYFISSNSFEREYTTSIQKEKTYGDKYFFNLGFGYEKQINSETTAWAGLIPVGYLYDSLQENIFSNATYDTIPGSHYSNDRLSRGGYSEIFLSIESQLKTWLTARIAAKRTYYYVLRNESDERVDYGLTRNLDQIDNRFRIYYGLGTHYKNFNLDLVVEPDVIYKGPYFLTGSTNSDFAYYMSGSYRW